MTNVILSAPDTSLFGIPEYFLIALGLVLFAVIWAAMPPKE